MPPRYDLVEQWRDHYVIERLGLRMGFVATADGLHPSLLLLRHPGDDRGALPDPLAGIGHP